MAGSATSLTNINTYQIQFIKQDLWFTLPKTMSAFLFLALIFLDFCCEFVNSYNKTKVLFVLRRILKQLSHLRNKFHIKIYWTNSDFKNSVCTYWVSGIRLESQEQNHGSVLWLGSVWCLFLVHLYRTANGTLQYTYN